MAKRPDTDAVETRLPAADAMTRVRVDEATAHGSQWSRTFPPEMMAEAAQRLAWLGLIYAATGLIGHFGRRVVTAWSSGVAFEPRFQDAVGVLAAAMGIAVYAIARSGRLSNRGLVNLATTFQVLGAFGLSIQEFWDGVPAGFDSAFPLIPVECVWIIGFPLIVPLPVPNVLASSLLAASAGPLALAISSNVTGTPVDRPVAVSAFFLSTTYLCAVVAYVVARIVHRVNVRLRHAREIGSYELLERIGQGGMGEVWRAKHRLLARPAAIKLIRSDVLGSSQQSREALVQRFEREAKDTATLGSTHTIEVYDFGVTEEGDFYYVMELLNGISFERYVQEFGPMEPARVVHLLRQVCHSLGEAHSRGLIHRDIKPANLFMCRLGPDDDFVKVLDFGLVKHVETSSARSMLTLEGITAGTPGFMAPEIALGKSGVDGRADLYSLGCVAFYLLTGQHVFAGQTPVATVLAHVQTPPQPPSARAEFPIPDELDAAILECLAKEPSDRPASAWVLDRRLADGVAADHAWTPEAARAWWDLRRVVVNPVESPAAGTRPESEPAPAVKRCWPRLCTPAPEQLVANR
jgi:eukaryotic-like serine/threonine-protein kinase